MTDIIESSAVHLTDYTPPDAMRATLARMQEQMGVMRDFFKAVMVEGEDYGTIPGTPTPTLLKPGAEKLCELYGFAINVPTIERDSDRDSGFYRASVIVRLTSRATGATIAEGVGEANTYEGRYRWRNAGRSCPSCGVAGSIIRGKEEYGGGWLCWKKKDGCGANFAVDDPAITEQVTGKVENDDLHTLWNTIVKMAKKRALVDATISATRSSGLFTQDLEDLPTGAPSPERDGNARGSQRSREWGPKDSVGPQSPADPGYTGSPPEARGDWWREFSTAMGKRRIFPAAIGQVIGATFSRESVRAFLDEHPDTTPAELLDAAAGVDGDGESEGDEAEPDARDV